MYRKKVGELTNVRCGRNPANRGKLKHLLFFDLIKTKGGECMEFKVEEIYKDSIGIYSITNISNNRIYVGQTRSSFYNRFVSHRTKFRRGEAVNEFMQNDWNFYGEDSFVFEIIEVCGLDTIDDKEKYWIKYYSDSDMCYNVRTSGGYPTAVGESNRKRLTGSKLSENTKKKMSETRKNKPHVKKKTDKYSEDDARKVKELFVLGYSSHEIMEQTNYPYRFLNGILSMNSWSTVKVDGWEEFMENREKGKGKRLDKKFHTHTELPQEKIEEILAVYSKLKNYSATAKQVKVCRATVKRYVDAMSTLCRDSEQE